MARRHKHDTAGNFSNSIWKQRQCSRWPKAVLQLSVNPQTLVQWYLEYISEGAVRGITQMVRASLTGMLWKWSAARKTYVLSLIYNSGLPTALILHFSIHTEHCTSHMTGAVSVRSVWGSYNTPADQTASAWLWLPSPAIPMGRWGTKLILPCAQEDLVLVKIFTEMTGQTGETPCLLAAHGELCAASDTQVSLFSARLGIALYPVHRAVQTAVPNWKIYNSSTTQILRNTLTENHS